MIKGNLLRKNGCILLAVALFISTMMTMPVRAAETQLEIRQEQKSEIIAVLNDLENQREIVGLEGIVFENLRIGNAVHTYEYIGGEFLTFSNMYPIIDGEKIILWAIDVGGALQVTSALVEELNDAVEYDQAFSIIYDRETTYLYMDGALIEFLEGEGDPRRGVIDNTETADLQSIQITALNENETLGYVRNRTRGANDYICAVDDMRQGAFENLCWAATVASIVNYCKGTSYTVAQIAFMRNFNGNLDLNLPANEIPGLLSELGLTYTHRGRAPLADEILECIQDDYPLYGSWGTSVGSKHATCIYGINTSSGNIYVMDPKFGFTTAVYDEVECNNMMAYRYIKPGTAIELYLTDGVWRN